MLSPLKEILASVRSTARVEPVAEDDDVPASTVISHLSEPLIYAGVTYYTTEGIILSISDPQPLSELQTQRAKLISVSDGTKDMKIVAVEVARQCRPGQPTSVLLGAMQSPTDRTYSLLPPHQRIRF